MKKTLLIMFAAFCSYASYGAEKLRIINATIVTPFEVIENSTVLIEDGIITDVVRGADKALPGAVTIDAKGMFVSAGFIDVHCHGGGGYDFSDATSEAMLGAAEMHARHGTTLIYPTTASCSNEILFLTFDEYRKADKINSKGAAFGGIHIEGGYFSMAMKGGQDPRYIKNPEPKDYNEILQRGGDIIKRWSFAPELPGAVGLMRELSRRGISMSMAHTSALFEDAVNARNEGVNSITHFYSMTSTVTRINALRYAGVLEAGYLFDDIYVETIGDGIHLPEPLLRLVYKVKGPDRIVGITDAMRGAGMPDGETILGSIHDGVPAIIEDGVAKLPDRSSFAGSICTMDRVVRTYMQKAGVELPKAIQMATLTPAQMMRIEDKKGLLAVNKDADIVIFDDQINIQATIVGGRVVYRK